MNVLTEINKIIELVELGEADAYSDLSYKSGGFGPGVIKFRGNNLSRYNEIINSLYVHDKDIEKTYTIKKYESVFINCFELELRTKQPVSESKAEEFVNYLKKTVIEDHVVYRPIYGIHLKDQSKVLELGAYRILHLPTVKDCLPGAGKESAKIIWERSDHEYLIGWAASARHHEKSIEIADDYFQKFEVTLRYMLGTLDPKYEVGILNYVGTWFNHAYVYRSDGPAGSASSKLGARETVPLDDEYFTDNSGGYKSIWEKIGSDSVTKFQSRLLLAIEWIGQALSERSYSSAFIKAAISLEIIFTYNEKMIISPSIMNQIAENTAMLLEGDVDARLEIEKKVKDLYGLRSAIAHSGKSDITRKQFIDMLSIARSVVLKICSEQSLFELRNIDNFYALLKRRKYSCGPLI